jgi:two-component system chemotaxis response regulator CheB
MAVTVLIADDSDVMLRAMRKFLEEESRIEVVGEASTFAKTMQMIADCKQDVLLLDLHIPEARGFTPAFVKSQLVSVECTLAVSFSNDSEAKALAEGYGASSLLDKMNLYSEMIPAILRCVHRSPQGAFPNKSRGKATARQGIRANKRAVHKHAA